ICRKAACTCFAVTSPGSHPLGGGSFGEQTYPKGGTIRFGRLAFFIFATTDACGEIVLSVFLAAAVFFSMALSRALIEERSFLLSSSLGMVPRSFAGLTTSVRTWV